MVELNAETSEDGDAALIISNDTQTSNRWMIYLVIMALLVMCFYAAVVNGHAGMSETKKNLIIQSLKRVSLRYGRLTQIMAIVMAFAVLLYYHVIGKRIVLLQEKSSKLGSI